MMRRTATSAVLTGALLLIGSTWSGEAAGATGRSPVTIAQQLECSNEPDWGSRTRPVPVGQSEGRVCRVAIGSSGSGVLHLLARDGAILDVDAVTECEVRWAANGLLVRVEMARSVRDPRRLELRQVTDSNGRVLYRWSECHQAADQPPGPASAAVVKAKARADAGAVAKAFYGAYRGMPPLGIPERKQLSKLLPYLSARLKQLLADAQRHQTAYAKQHPDDKPPFVDGDLFSSNFEGFSTFTIGDVQTEGSTFRVDVQLTYSDPQKPRDVTRWKDAAIVVRENGRFVIDDFEFKGDWPFATRGRLSEILRARD